MSALEELDENLELEQRMSRFHVVEETNNPVADYKINLFDPLVAVYKWLDLLQGKEILLCKRKIDCKCKDLNNCTCDDDHYVELTLIKGDDLSNCRFLLEFNMSDNLSKIDKKKELLRAFALDAEGGGDNEQVLFDLSSEKITLYLLDGKKIVFDLDECYGNRFLKLSVSFSYMLYDNC